MPPRPTAYRILPAAACLVLAALAGIARATLFEEFASACGQRVAGASLGQAEPASIGVGVVGATVSTAAETALTAPSSLPTSVAASGNGVFGDLGACALGGESEARIVLAFSLEFLPAPPALPGPVPIVIEASGGASVAQEALVSVARVRAAVGAQERSAEACLGSPALCQRGQVPEDTFDSPFVVSLLPGDYELVLDARGSLLGTGTYTASLALLGFAIDPTFAGAQDYLLTVESIPEPGSLLLASLALAGLAALRRGRFR